MENQGRRKDQIEFSEKMIFWSVSGIIIILIIILILRLVGLA
jgi:hypothetical protein